MEMEGDTVTLEDAVVENRFVPIVDFRTLPEKWITLILVAFILKDLKQSLYGLLQIK